MRRCSTWPGVAGGARRTPARLAFLAGDLFDHTLRIHKLSGEDRELLEYAALLHDIGEHVSTEGHHRHTGYLIQHGRLRGFDPEEVLALASVARYHRSGEPKTSHEPFGSLSPERQERVTKLASILRLADGLDRGHSSAVEGIDVQIDDGRVEIQVRSGGEVELELWGARRKRALFERLFDRRVDVDRPKFLTRSPSVHPGANRFSPALLTFASRRE